VGAWATNGVRRRAPCASAIRALFTSCNELRSPCTTTLSRFWDSRSCGTATTPSEIENNIMGNRLYVGNLSFQSNSDSIRTTFAAFGSVTDVHVVMDRESGQSRGFAFVTMGSAQEAAKAIAQMNGATLDGRELRVNEAEERPSRGGGGGGGGGGGAKRERW
jgi:RNA recognition motif-containing protein